MWLQYKEYAMKRIKLICGDEFDVLTKARKVYKYTQKSGVCKKVKRRYNRRFRQIAKQEYENEWSV